MIRIKETDFQNFFFATKRIKKTSDRNLKDQLTIISALAKPVITEMGLHANRSTPVRQNIGILILRYFFMRF